MVGKTLDNRYKLEKKIGSGGMADVYMATDLLLDRVVAVKVLHSSFAEDNDFIVRFRHEAQSAGNLHILILWGYMMLGMIREYIILLWSMSKG